MDTTKRFKNPWFWVGLASVIIAASGIDAQTLTSWHLVVEAIYTVIANPVTVAAVALAILAVFINPTTKGIRD